jgi:hypothetical protein
MPEFTIRIKNMGSFVRAMNDAPKLMLHNINEAIKNSTDYVFQTTKDEYIAGGKGYLKAPIHSGLMRNTMRRTVYDLRGEVFPSVSYAYYVHEGTSTSTKYGRRPFLEDALADSEDFIQKEFDHAIEKTFARVAIDARTGV